MVRAAADADHQGRPDRTGATPLPFLSDHGSTRCLPHERRVCHAEYIRCFLSACARSRISFIASNISLQSGGDEMQAQRMQLPAWKIALKYALARLFDLQIFAAVLF